MSEREIQHRGPFVTYLLLLKLKNEQTLEERNGEQASDLLLPLEALRRERFFSRPRLFSPPSLVAPDFSLPRCLLLSSSFFFVGEGALSDTKERCSFLHPTRHS